MCLGVFLFEFACMGLFLDNWTWVAISVPMLEKFLIIISSNIFYALYVSLLSLGLQRKNSNFGALKILSVLSLGLLSFLLILPFSFLFYSASFISTILSSRSLIYSSASVILLLVFSSVIFISVIVLLIADCSLFLLFIISRSLLNISCIFSIHASILFVCASILRFYIIFIIIALNCFSGRLPISSSFVWSCGFLICSFICWKFSVFSFCWTSCVWGLLSTGCRIVVPLTCGVFPQWVGLDQCLQ